MFVKKNIKRYWKALLKGGDSSVSFSDFFFSAIKHELNKTNDVSKEELVVTLLITSIKSD